MAPRSADASPDLANDFATFAPSTAVRAWRGSKVEGVVYKQNALY